MKRFLSALILRFLPTLQPPAVMLDARESIRKAWAAVSDRLPTEMPVFTLPKLPEITLPRLKLPALPAMPEMPAMPSMSALGRFFSGLSISTLIFAPGQLQGIAAFCHFAAGDLAPQADTPRIEQIASDLPVRAADVACEVSIDRAWASIRPAAWRIAAALETSIAADAMPLAVPAPEAVAALALAWPEPREETISNSWSEACERGQRPPPGMA